eukprot:231511-Chlamydomonas_euryale.AAC.1
MCARAPHPHAPWDVHVAVHALERGGVAHTLVRGVLGKLKRVARARAAAAAAAAAAPAAA